MSRTVKLDDIGIMYTEMDNMSIYIHLLRENDGSFGFYVTAAENEFEAIMSAAMSGKVVHTSNLIEVLGALGDTIDDALFDYDNETG